MKKIIIEIPCFDPEIDEAQFDSFISFANEKVHSLYVELGAPHPDPERAAKYMAGCIALDVQNFSVKIVDM